MVYPVGENLWIAPASVHLEGVDHDARAHDHLQAVRLGIADERFSGSASVDSDARAAMGERSFTVYPNPSMHSAIFELPKAWPET